MINKLIEKYKIAVEEYTEEREKAKTKSSRARIKERKTVWWVIAIRSDEKINTYKKILQDLEELKQQLDQANKKLDKIKEYIENNSLYEEEYDYDYDENIQHTGTNDEKAKRDILSIIDGE